jgi:hypothetical protein
LEVGNAAAFLCSDLASGITGEITYIDSGYNFYDNFIFLSIVFTYLLVIRVIALLLSPRYQLFSEAIIKPIQVHFKILITQQCRNLVQIYVTFTSGSFIRSKYTLQNTEGAIKNGQPRETGNIGYTKRRQANQKYNPIYVGHHYAQTSINDVNF